VDPFAEIEVSGVLVPVPFVEDASVEFLDEADFFAAYQKRVSISISYFSPL
jgi:hypothetical protein